MDVDVRLLQDILRSIQERVSELGEKIEKLESLLYQDEE